MWNFVSENRNWILAVLTALCWGGPVIWYFWQPVRDVWRSRLDHWTRD